MAGVGVQRRRVKGWRMPPGTRSVTRGTAWGNDFKVGRYFKKYTADWSVMTIFDGDTPVPGHEVVRDLEHSIQLFEEYAVARLTWDPDWLAPLRGLHLACFCPLDSRCHRDVLLRLIKEKYGDEA